MFIILIYIKHQFLSFFKKKKRILNFCFKQTSINEYVYNLIGKFTTTEKAYSKEII